MTAVNLIVGRSASYLISDRASICADGKLATISTKIHFDDRLRIAISSSGIVDGGAAQYMAEWLASMRRQKDAMDSLPQLLRTLDRRRNQEGLKGWSDWPTTISLFVAIWSEAGGPEGYVLTSGPGHLPDRVRPFTLHPVQQYLQPHVPPPFADAWTFDPESHARILVEAQRQHKGAEACNSVGGGADIVTVDRDGARCECLVDWPDRVGREIEPKRRRFWNPFRDYRPRQ